MLPRNREELLSSLPTREDLLSSLPTRQCLRQLPFGVPCQPYIALLAARCSSRYPVFIGLCPILLLETTSPFHLPFCTHRDSMTLSQIDILIIIVSHLPSTPFRATAPSDTWRTCFWNSFPGSHLKMSTLRAVERSYF